MWIAVDSGNTRIKWALIDNNDTILSIHHTPKTDITQLIADSQNADWVCIAHVGTDDEKKQLDQQLSVHVPVLFLKSKRQVLGLTNYYQPADALGVDRWLCLLAARQYSLPLIVVSAGTAVTVEYLSNNSEYHGGIILPGLRLMQSVLSSATPLPLGDLCSNITLNSSIPNNTNDAIATGILMAVCGAIERFKQSCNNDASIIITGGDAPILASLFPTATIVSDLIFRGIIHLKRGELASRS